jgi:CIC family chloride channel protein
MTQAPAPATGYDVKPSRPTAFTIVLFACVVVLAATTAHIFRKSAEWALDVYLDTRDVTIAADREAWLLVFAVVTGAVLVAAGLGEWVHRRWGGWVGIEAVAASARGESRRISLRATAVRVGATWIASAGMASIGREAALVESGGATGHVVARRTHGKGDAMAVAGMAAAFAAAYQAPIAAVLYIEEHLRIRRSRRATMFAVIAAGGGFATSTLLFGSDPVFDEIDGSRWRALAMALVVLLPAALAARLFLQLRVKLADRAWMAKLGLPRWAVMTGMSVIAGAAVATFPFAAGNGGEGLRHASVAATFLIATSLFVGKLIGTSAVIGSGSPCGVITPTMGITGGAALTVLLLAERWGVDIGNPWGPTLLAAAVGVAVGLRAPLVAIFLIPEMLGDYTLLPLVAVVVAVAVGVDRALDVAVVKVGALLPTGVYDEDA